MVYNYIDSYIVVVISYTLGQSNYKNITHIRYAYMDLFQTRI